LPDYAAGDIGEKVNEFRKEHQDIFIEVVLHIKADLLENQLKENDPGAFKRRLEFFNGIISNY
jgi:hypothetical protein